MHYKNLFSYITLAAFIFTNFFGLFPTQKVQAATAMRMETGYYMGTGSVQNISGLGFQPNMIVIKADTAAGAAVVKTSSMPTPNTAFFTAVADDATSQIVLQADGFSVGTNAAVNAVNVRYTYMAFTGSDCTSGGEFCVGIYVGDGTFPKAITTGFQPDLVWVKRSGTSANWRSSVMSPNMGQYFDATTGNVGGNLFTIINSDGFSVGSTNNANLGVYYYMAWKGSSSKVAVGSYVGNATDDRTIGSLPFSPDAVIVKNANAVAPTSAVYATRESYGDNSSFFTAAAATSNLIQDLLVNSFQIGSASATDGNANNFYWSAFAGVGGNTGTGTFRIATGSYTGTGVANSITGLGFSPDLVIIKHRDQVTDQFAVFRTSLMMGDSTAFFANAAANFVGGITALGADGFSIGTNATVNTTSDVYYWTAYGNAWKPNTRTGASDFIIGAYTGNGIDNRDIKRLPFTPDLISIKQNATTVGMWRTSAQIGDYSIFYSALAGINNAIQSFGSNSFQIGNSGNVNTANGINHWFGFKSGMNLAIGTYVGTGSSQNITTVGFNPQYLWTKAPAATTGTVARTINGSTDQALPFINTPQLLGAITALLSNGFTVGTAPETNANSMLYTYAAWKIPDITPPVGAVTYSDIDTIVKQGDVLTLNVIFSEPVLDTPVPSITFTGANTVTNAPMTKLTSTTYTYNHTVTGGNGATTVTFSSGTDLSGNTITSTPSSGGAFTVDNLAPTNQDSVFPASLSVVPSAVVPITSSGVATNQIWCAPLGTTTFLPGVTMTQAVSGLSTSIVAPVTPGVYYIYVIDVAGNISASSIKTLTVDNTSPTVVISTSIPSPTNTLVIPVTVTFNEPVQNFVLGDLTLTNATAGNFLGTGAIYTFDVIPTPNTTATVNILAGVATDLATNPNIAASPLSIISDQVPPAAVVSSVLPGSYTTVQNLSFSSLGSTAIRYTVDGSIPTCTTGTLFTVPVVISTTSTVKVIACDGAANSSAISTGVYTIIQETITQSSGGGGGSGGSSSSFFPVTPVLPVVPVTSSGTVTPVSIDKPVEITPLVFSDVEKHWSKPYVETLRNQCNIQGYKNLSGSLLGEFRPENFVTRAELAQMIAQCLRDKNSQSSTTFFADVPLHEWFASAVTLGKERGYIAGNDDGNFYPESNANRAEALKMILLAQYPDQEIPVSKTTSLRDVPPSVWYEKYVTFALEKGYVSGYLDEHGMSLGLFMPTHNITRGETAKIIVHVLGL